MSASTHAALHDAYAADYDDQVKAYDCYLTDVLFGLCYEFVRPGQVMLDAGIGSGLSAQLFARAGLQIYGMDFSQAMLEICRNKRLTAELQQHDIAQVPWPYPAGQFDHVICCGVLHFVADLENIFGEAARVVRPGGLFAFTTMAAASPPSGHEKYERQRRGEFEIFSHTAGYFEALLARDAFTHLKKQKCFVGDDLFDLRVVHRN
jgi:ubiquinone/menaquinone biosynthesis C-methylase UbiE